MLAFREDREGTVTGTYAGGDVVAGALAGRRDGAEVAYGFTQVARAGTLTVGTVEARVEDLGDGRVRLHETWTVQPSGASGSAVLDELPGDRLVRTRLVRTTRSVTDAVALLGDLLGLAVDGPHDATPYELAVVELPGGAQLELTTGPGEDLLVLQVPTRADVAAVRERVEARGVALEPLQDPHWARLGFGVRDPDGRLVVVASLPA